MKAKISAGTCGLVLAMTVCAQASTAQSWEKAMKQSFRLIQKAVQVGDRQELIAQSLEVRRQLAEVSSWPDEDRWNFARVYCANMAQELANYADDKLKSSARGELAAEASFKAFRSAESNCKRGLIKVK